MLRQRYAVIGLVVAGLLVSLALAHGLQWIWVETGWSNPAFFVQELQLTNIVGFVVGMGGAVVCIRVPSIFGLVNEVIDELTKTTWPTREETGHATVVVIFTVLICSAYLGVFDALWLWLTDLVLDVPPTVSGG